MDNEIKQQAKELYYQTDLTKTEIANALGISRRALHYWIKAYRWEAFKDNAAVLPSLLAEKCYFIMGHLTDHYLGVLRNHKPVTHTEADTLYKLMLTVRKLKSHSTLNESMEMFKNFHDRLAVHDKQLSDALSPHIERYFDSRASDTIDDCKTKDYDTRGRLIPQGEIDPDGDFGPTEKQLDENDSDAWHFERLTIGYNPEPPTYDPDQAPAQSDTPELTPTLTPELTPALTPALTPTLTPTLTPEPTPTLAPGSSALAPSAPALGSSALAPSAPALGSPALAPSAPALGSSALGSSSIDYQSQNAQPVRK